MISFFDHFPGAGRTSLSTSVMSKSRWAAPSINASRLFAISFISEFTFQSKLFVEIIENALWDKKRDGVITLRLRHSSLRETSKRPSGSHGSGGRYSPA